MKWDGIALCDSALQSLNAKLSSLSADVRAWGGAPPAYCTLGLAGLILGWLPTCGSRERGVLG